MKIVIVGSGAMGCLFAHFLTKSKEEIWILDKTKERAAQISQCGIMVEGMSGKYQVKVKATAEVKEIGQADLVIICVKSYDTKEAVMLSKGLVGENTSVLTLQNGICNL